MQGPISPPRVESLLSPLLASLPSAAVSPSPPTALLPLLSPILRQRVQLLSGASSDPWLPLLCYDSSQASKLEGIAKDERLEPHPVSGEVEVEWDEVQCSYKRIDEETLQALVEISTLGLSTRLVWCINDEAGGGDGWRIGEVGVVSEDSSGWGKSSISAAESLFKASIPQSHTTGNLPTPDADGDDDDYWAQYDKTPGTTPGPANDAPTAMTGTGESEDSYYAQYASVQPAMDSHDPDEALENGPIESSLGQDSIHQGPAAATTNSWTQRTPPPHVNAAGLLQPRPASAGSSSSETVEKLEKRAEMDSSREQSEVGIKQHISTSVQSLYRLAKAAGIERGEFERLVRTELEVLALMDQEDEL